MYVDDLVRDGFVVIEDAIDPEFCDATVERRLTERGWTDPATWPVGPVHLAASTSFPLATVAPRAAAALAHLVGGADRCTFSDIPDNLIINFPDPTADPVDPVDRAQDPTGWHKDGDWFRHFLDSPEQGLLGIVLWRDVTDDMGPTLVAVDSLQPMARLLAAHPMGLEPKEVLAHAAEILADCSDIRPLTGSKGTVVFAHPFLLHAASVNTSDALRIISNTSVMLREPMRFDARDRSCTDVEAATLALLGVDTFEFTATGDRGRITTERERLWAEGRDTGAGTRAN